MDFKHTAVTCLGRCSVPTCYQRLTHSDVGRTTNGPTKSYNKVSGCLYEDKDSVSASLTKRNILTTQARNRTITCSSVRERSALYLLRAASIGSIEVSTQPGKIGTSERRIKSNKMSERSSKVTVSDTCHDEDLPLPPPPPMLAKALDYEGSSALNNPPVPPPKETFSTYYQQRQKSELKRLFKHIHPDIRHLGYAVDDDIINAVHTDDIEPADVSYLGEVQSMKWIFENWNLDTIGDLHTTNKLLEKEDLTGGNVRSTSSMFEHSDGKQPFPQALTKRQISVRGDVRTSAWLFETQPLDALNKKEELVEAMLKEPIQPGDVSKTRLLFETKRQSDVGRCNSIEDSTFLKLMSELQEQKGDVQKTVKLFQAERSCAFRDKSGNIHTVKSICREEINSGNTNSVRWLFETQPLDLINKESDEVKIIQGISLEEAIRGGVDRKRWMFETQSFDTIQEAVEVDNFKDTLVDYTKEADVTSKKKLFEKQPLTTLGGNNEKILENDKIIGMDVKTSLWLFETQRMETLKDNYEVGCLKKITLSADEQGAIKDLKKIFESSCPENPSLRKQPVIERGNVMGFKQLFETIPLSKITNGDDENNTSENQRSEDTPLYALKDSSGNFHKLTNVSREEFIKGKVQNYKWMFETKPLHDLTEGKENVEIIKGITREEDTMGDVKLAKWLFETQTTNGIHCKFNQMKSGPSVEAETCKGDVKTCKWLFETQPMDVLYEKSDKASEKETIDNNSVKSITWLFESQPLDSIKDGEEYNLNLSTTPQDAAKSKIADQTVKHLFETEILDSTRNDETEHDLRCISKVNFQSGDVSRVKELFETQSLDEIGSEMVASPEYSDDQIQRGSVHKFTWLFENCPMNTLNKEDVENIEKINEAVNGDVKNKKFIFETSSLDKIQEQPLEQRSVDAELLKSDVNVKTSTMMFESLPLYAIRDKEGQFHEVTTVKKDEVLSGDVRGARWMFETRPLEAIKAENEVYVIRAVTQEDVEKGDVKSARWKFETQPLDSLNIREEPSVKVTEDVGSSNVQLNKQLFESESNNKLVRMVSVTDIQRGDVRTSTWLFENQAIDSLKGEPQEQSPVKTVHREDTQKGDVKRCTWLFESQPLDKIKEPVETSLHGSEETISEADMKCTTWLFETTPLDKINDTMSFLSKLNLITSSGIVIEEKERQNVTMAKFSVESPNDVQIQKQEVVEGNLRNIILQLLFKPSGPKVTLLREVEKGKVNTTEVQLPVYQSSMTTSIDRDQILQNIVHMIDELLCQDTNFKKGILMQETTSGEADISVYSLICHCKAGTQSPVIQRCDVKPAIGNLLATASSPKIGTSCKIHENEKGNVNLYTNCIENGDLSFLKSLHSEETEDNVEYDIVGKEQIEIVQGNVREAKRSLCQQKEMVERTIVDVQRGDVKNTKKVFSSECSIISENTIPRDDIIPGDVSTAKQQLATIQTAVVQKEDIVAGDIKASMQSLERAKKQSLIIERESVIPGNIYDMDLSCKCPEPEGSQVQKEAIVFGDVKAAKKSLQMAKQQGMHVERGVLAPGKLYNLDVSAQEGNSSVVVQSSSPCRNQQMKTCPKVSGVVKSLENHVSVDSCQQGDISNSANLNSCSAPDLPFISNECNELTTEDEPEDVIEGDIKSAIRSLQIPAMEQRFTDNEDIMRGTIQQALQSLEKSNVNVSKGDFKSAMLYRNSGRASSGKSKAVHKQNVAVSMLSIDTTLSPSISVTCEDQASTTAHNPSYCPVENGSSKAFSSEVVNAPPCLATTPQKLKPAFPAKPEWTKPKITDCANVSHVNKINPLSPENAKHYSPLPHDKFIADKLHSTSPSDERNAKQKINGAEEIEQLMTDFEDNSKHERNLSLKHILNEFERKGLRKNNPGLNNIAIDKCELNNPIKNATITQHCSSNISPLKNQPSENDMLETGIMTNAHQTTKTTKGNDSKVVLRNKKVCETETEWRQRLSKHMDEIVMGNVEAATEIFENMKKREELKGILSQVQEIEGERSNVVVGSLKLFCNNIPGWMVSVSENSKDDDLESVSSVETVFEDLENASKVIIDLKEQTLAKLLDIEETIKKALYSISNLKSDADIAGLSGLFDESLKSEQPNRQSKNIRKISIVSSKVKSGQGKDIKNTPTDSCPPKQEKDRKVSKATRQSSFQSSPSFISIHSAARKPIEQSKPPMGSVNPSTEMNGQGNPTHEYGPKAANSKVSVIQVQTVPDEPAAIIDTKTVSETYKETDGFGNVFVSSVTSTFVAKQSDRESAAVFEVAGGPSRYEVMTSPLCQSPSEVIMLSNANEKGKTFSKAKEEQ
ncbi:xin actin-binding repeat-containing protein 1 isoform X1 [Stigmatopora nigra]